MKYNYYLSLNNISIFRIGGNNVQCYRKGRWLPTIVNTQYMHPLTEEEFLKRIMLQELIS